MWVWMRVEFIWGKRWRRLVGHQGDGEVACQCNAGGPESYWSL